MSDYDSDAPEEFNQDQAIEKDEELRQIQIENKARVVREGKERRKLWAQKLTPRPSAKAKKDETAVEADDQDSLINQGFLPKNTVKLLAAREKKVFSSDSEEDEQHEDNTSSRKKKRKKSGMGPVMLNDIPPPPCLNNALEFLKKRNMAVARSSAVLTNSSKALRLVSRMYSKQTPIKEMTYKR